MCTLKHKPAKGENRCNLGRLEYLDQLVIEFQTSESKDAKEQILANLANFAYDPFNYNYFRELNILDLFLDNLSSTNENLIQFSAAGLCNLCLDQINKEYIIKNGLQKLVKLLNHNNEEIVLSVITTLMFLITPCSKSDITGPDIVKLMVKYSKNKNSRIKNLATIFLEDYCSKKEVRKATEAFENSLTSSVDPSAISFLKTE